MTIANFTKYIVHIHWLSHRIASCVYVRIGNGDLNDIFVIAWAEDGILTTWSRTSENFVKITCLFA